MASSDGSSKPPLPLSYVRGALLAIPPANTSEYKIFEARFKANLVSTAHVRAPGYLKHARRALFPSLRHELLEFDRYLFERRYNVTENDQNRRQQMVRALETLKKLIRSEEEEEERGRMVLPVGVKRLYEPMLVVKGSEGPCELAGEEEEEGMIDITRKLVSYLREGPGGDMTSYVHVGVREAGTRKEHGKIADESGHLGNGLEVVHRELKMCQLDGGDDRDDELPQHEDPTSQLDKGKERAEDEDGAEGGGSDSDESELGVLGELIYAAIENRFPILKMQAVRAEVEAAREKAEAYAAADQHRPVFSIPEKQAPRSVTAGQSASFSMLGLPNVETPPSTTPNTSPPPSTPLSAPIPTTVKSGKTPTYTYSRRKPTVRKLPTTIMGHAVTRRDPTYLSPPSQANSTTRSPPPLKTETGASMTAQDMAQSANGGIAMAGSSEETRPPLTKSAKRREKMKAKMANTRAPVDPKIDKEKKAAKKMRQAAAKKKVAEKVNKGRNGDEVCGEEVTADNLQEDEPEKTKADDEVWSGAILEKSGIPSDKSQEKVDHPVDSNTSNSNVDLSTPITVSLALTLPKVESSVITLAKEADESPSMNSSSTFPKGSSDDNLPKKEDETLSSDSLDGTPPKELLDDNLPEEDEAPSSDSSDSDSSDDSPDPTPLSTSPGPGDRTMYPNLYIGTPADLSFMAPFVLKSSPISPPRHVVKDWHLGVDEVQARVKHYSRVSRLAMNALEHLHASPAPVVEAAKQKCRKLNHLHREALMESTRIWFMMTDWQIEQVFDADTLDPNYPQEAVMVKGRGGLWPEWFYRSAIKRNRYSLRCEDWDMDKTNWTLEWRGDGWYPRPPGKDHEDNFENCGLCEEKRVVLKDHVTEVVMNEMLDFFNPPEGNLDGYGKEAKEMLTRMIDLCVGGQMGYYRQWEECALDEKPWEDKPTSEAERVSEHPPNVDDEQQEENEGQPEESDSHIGSESKAIGSGSEEFDSDKAAPPPSELRLGKKKVAADPFSEDPNACEPEAPKPKNKSTKKKHHMRKKKTGGVSKETVKGDSDAESQSSSKTVRSPNCNTGLKVASLYGIGNQRVTMAVHPTSSGHKYLKYIPSRPPPNEYPHGDCPSDSESDTSHGPSYPDPTPEPWNFPDALNVYSELPPWPAFRYRVGHGFQVVTYPNEEEMDIIAPYNCTRIPGANPRKHHTVTFVFNYKNADSGLPIFWVADVIEKLMIDHDVIQVPVTGGGYVRAWGPPIYGKWVSVSWPQDVEKPRTLIIDLVEKMHKRRCIWNQGSFDEWLEHAMERAPDYREGEWQRKSREDW